MYIFLDKNKASLYNKVKMAEDIGVHPNTLRAIINRQVPCSKILAFSITKFLDENAEIEDFFKLIN